MEGKANNTAVGLFTIAVLAGAFFFIYWLARADEGGSRQPVTVYFSGPVTGLSRGSPVLFNGIKVGEVSSLALDPSAPERVVAQISVSPDTPVKKDTQVGLSYQGLTGVAYVDLKGGASTGDPIWAFDEPAVLEADSTAVQDLLDGARDLIGRIDSILIDVDRTFAESTPQLQRTLANVERMTEALAEESGSVGELVASVSSAAGNLSELSTGVTQAVGRVDRILAAVEPEKIAGTIDNVQSLTQAFVGGGGAAGITDRLTQVADNVVGVSENLANVGREVETVVRETSGQVQEIVSAVDPESVKGILDNSARLTAAVPPEAVTRTVANVADVTDAVASRREEIGGAIDNVATAAGDVSTFAGRLDEIGAQAQTTFGQVGASVEALTGAIDTQEINQTIAGFSSFAQTLGNQGEELDLIVTRLATVSDDVSRFTPRLPEIADNVATSAEQAKAIVTAIDPEAINTTVTQLGQAATRAGEIAAAIDPTAMNTAVTNVGDVAARAGEIAAAIDPQDVAQATAGVSSFAQTLAGQGEELDLIVTRLTTVSEDVGRFTPRLPEIGDSLASAADQAEALATAIDAPTINAAVSRIGEVAAAIDPQQIGSTVDGLSRFSQTLGENAEELDVISGRLSAITADVNAFTPRLPEIGESLASAADRAEALASAVDAGTINAAVERVGSVASAIDPQQVSDAVTGAATFAQALGRNTENVDAIATRLANVTGDVEAFTPQLQAIGQSIARTSDRTAELVQAIDPGAVNRAVNSVAETAEALDAEALNRSIQNIDRLTTGLANQTERVETIFASADDIASDIRAFTPRLPELGARIGEASEKTAALVAAIDPVTVNRTVENIGEVAAAVDSEQVRSSVENLSRFAEALGGGSEQVSQIIAEAQQVSSRLISVAERADNVLGALDSLVGQEGEGVLTDARNAIASIRDAATSIQVQTSAIGEDVSRFSGRGLREVEALVRDGRGAVKRLESIIGQIESSPRDFIFGGSNVPEYNGSRRR